MSDRAQEIQDRQRAYQRLFLGDDGKLNADGELILSDLARFCRLNTSTTVVSPVSRQVDVPASFQAEGRREVIQRILSYVHVETTIAVNLTNEVTDE